MRVCQLMIGTGFGGAERSFVDTAVALADGGHAVQAVFHRDFVKRALLESHPNIVATPVVVHGAWDLLAIRRLRRAIGRFGPDVIHTHLARGAWLGGQAGRSLGVPVVAKLHNYAKLKYYRFVDGFIATTSDQGRYLDSHGIASDRFAVVPNFSRMPEIEAIRTKPAVSSQRVRFVTCGRLHEVKGFDLLLAALAELRASGVDSELVIGGDGPERQALLQRRDELGLQDCVQFAGWVDDPAAVLDRGDVYVLSSRSESFGIALLEAMARGLPIVSTRCQGPLQLLRDDLAWFAPVEDASGLARAMAAAARDPAERIRRATELRRIFLERYSEARVMPSILEFYRNVGAVDSRGPAPAVDPRSAHNALRVHPEYESALRARGWTTVAAVMQAVDVERIRTKGDRDNCWVQFPDGRRAFLKRHWEPVSRSPEALASSGLAESEAVERCESSGVPAVKTIAAGERISCDPATGRPVRESFYLSEAFNQPSGFDRIKRMWDEGRQNHPSMVEERRGMIVAAARSVRRLHAAGLYHQDLFWQHLFFEKDAAGRLVARMIDLQRAINPPPVLVAHYWLKDMEQLRFSMQRMRFTSDEIELWYRAYFNGPREAPLSVTQRLLAWSVRIRGLNRGVRLAIRNWRTTEIAMPPGSIPFRRAA